jgi:hypothetical protein
MSSIIIRNAMKCLTCDEVIESKHVHDYVRCSCGALAVDGGREYLRRSYGPTARWEDLSEVEERGSFETNHSR